jgi:hypothetical protein
MKSDEELAAVKAKLDFITELAKQEGREPTGAELMAVVGNLTPEEVERLAAMFKDN